MKWYQYVAYFFGGMFMTNAIPHLVNGVSGRPMQTPFAHPPGQGLSSALVNVLWGMVNLVIGYLLVYRVGSFDLRKNRHALSFGLGVVIMAIMLAKTFAKFYSGN